MFGQNLFKRTLLSLTLSGLKRTTKSKSMIRSLVERGVEQSLVLEIEYTDENGVTTTREIEPLEWEVTIVKARCRERLDFRSFRIDRIKSARWTGDVFDPENNSLIEKGDKLRGKNKTATA